GAVGSGGVDDLECWGGGGACRAPGGAAEGGGAAGEVGEAPARLFNDDLQSSEVPWLEVDIDHGLGLSAGHECVAEEVAVGALAVGAIDQPLIGSPGAVAPQCAGSAENQHGVLQRRHR